MMKVLTGPRQDDKRSRQGGMVKRVKMLCADELKFCPPDRSRLACALYCRFALACSNLATLGTSAPQVGAMPV
jgi:hypothetical protein